MARTAKGKLGAALASLKAALEATGIPWMIIGGIAVIAHGVRRTTADIDVALQGEGTDLAAIVRIFARHGMVPRIPRAVEFARQTQVLLLEHSATGIELDICLAWLSFEDEALSSPVRIDFAGVKAPAARPEDLLIYKLFAGRPQDVTDAETLLLLHRKAVDLVRVRRVLEELGRLADDPSIPGRLDAISAKPPKSSSRASAKRRRD